MFNNPTTPSNEWKSVNNSNIRPETTVNINKTVNLIGKDQQIKPRIVTDNSQGRVVDARTTPVPKKKK